MFKLARVITPFIRGAETNGYGVLHLDQMLFIFCPTVKNVGEKTL